MTSLFSQFQLVQSGYDGPEEHNVPIELPYKNVSNWLVDCRLTPRDVLTKNGISKIVDKSIDLLNALAQRDVGNLALRSDCEALLQRISSMPWMYHYFDYQSLLEALLVSGEEPVTKTLFGNYSSELLHVWEDTRAKWAKNNGHVAHASLLLSQAVNHELPALRATQDRLSKQMLSLSIKQADVERSLNFELDSYESQYKKHHLQAPSLDIPLATSELQKELNRQLSAAMAAALPAEADSLTLALTQSSGLQNALQYYKDWMKTAAPTATCSFATLQLLADKGSSILTCSIDSNGSISTVVPEESEDTIDWGDFGIEVEPSDAPSQVTLQTPSESESRSSPLAICRALGDELDLLKTFFKQRILDLSSSTDFLDLVMGRTMAAFSEFVNARNNVQALNDLLHSIGQARRQLDSFVEKLAIFNDVRRNEIVFSLVSKRSKLLRLRAIQQSIAAKRRESDEALQSLQLKISAAKTAIVALRSQLEAQLSALCRGRSISIMLPSDL